MGLVERVVARHLEARKHKPLEPAINKKKDRVVYVLPETLKKDVSTYEAYPKDEKDHIKNRGKPQRPARPRKPKRPHKPEIPRAVEPAPLRPPRKPQPAQPVSPVPLVKKVPLVKRPGDNLDEKRKWKVQRPKPLQASDISSRVVERFLSK